MRPLAAGDTEQSVVDSCKERDPVDRTAAGGDAGVFVEKEVEGRFNRNTEGAEPGEPAAVDVGCFSGGLRQKDPNESEEMASSCAGGEGVMIEDRGSVREVQETAVEGGVDGTM